MSDDELDAKQIPSAKKVSLQEGYNQTYVIYKSSSVDSKETNPFHEVFFRCGNWCYKGPIEFGSLHIGIDDLPVIIPTLQRQQSSLRYFCPSNSLPQNDAIAGPINFLHEANDFVAGEIVSDHVSSELQKWASVFTWIDDDNASTYFELMMDTPPCMDSIALIASKTYTRGLIVISIYYENVLYFLLQAGEGDQYLLDVRFPNVSNHGQGLHILSYNDPESYWKKLTLWHTIETQRSNVMLEIPKISTTNLTSSNYTQTYCILKSDPSPQSGLLSIYHDVLFRFGSWCYSGRVQLTPQLTLADIPYVIPALRMQQSRLEFFCDASKMPLTSSYAGALEYMQSVAPIIDNEIYKSEETLHGLIDRLNKMGLGESVSKWLEGDPQNSFFEFRIAPDASVERFFEKMELIASKSYNPNGIITITLWFKNIIYVTVLDGTEEQPLLDSRFPDVSAKGRGYQLQTYPNGVDGWDGLRKVSIWQTATALEQEFRDRAALLAQSKKENEEGKALLDEDNEAESKEEKRVESVAEKKGLVEPERVSAKGVVEESVEPAGDKAEHVTPASSAKIDDSADAKLGAKALPAMHVARPHHIPKNDALSKRMEEIRKSMGNDGGLAAWDAGGKPVLKSGKRK